MCALDMVCSQILDSGVLLQNSTQYTDSTSTEKPNVGRCAGAGACATLSQHCERLLTVFIVTNQPLGFDFARA